MSKKFLSIFKLVILVMFLLQQLTVFSFAASIVSPACGNISYADSLLISVKLSDQKTVQISVYKEQIASEIELIDEKGQKKQETVYTDVDAQNLTADDLALIASGETEDENGEALLLSNREPIPEYFDALISPMVEYKNPTEGIAFYTKKISDLTPGLYKVVVETKDEKNLVCETVISYTAIQIQQDEKKDIFSENSSGTLQFLQKFLRNLFK